MPNKTEKVKNALYGEAAKFLIVKLLVEFEENVPSHLQEKFEDIPILDTNDDLSLEDFKYPIKDVSDFERQILKWNEKKSKE